MEQSLIAPRRKKPARAVSLQFKATPGFKVGFLHCSAVLRCATLCGEFRMVRSPGTKSAQIGPFGGEIVTLCANLRKELSMATCEHGLSLRSTSRRSRSPPPARPSHLPPFTPAALRPPLLRALFARCEKFTLDAVHFCAVVGLANRSIRPAAYGREASTVGAPRIVRGGFNRLQHTTHDGGARPRRNRSDGRPHPFLQMLPLNGGCEASAHSTQSRKVEEGVDVAAALQAPPGHRAFPKGDLATCASCLNPATEQNGNAQRGGC